ncbi:conserved protein of unknown function (plasmid) [Pararobbsia alpina]|uniref:hypothetical protein n=1 Tax=Pararobbsia alpina TaxID=621374 RepID=UPI0039A5C20E
MDTSKIGWLAQLKKTVFGRSDTSEQPSNTRCVVPVGTGAANERVVTLDGVPNLFRDEGNFVAHFVAQFATEMRETRFGTKLLPSVAPHWALSETFVGDSLAGAVGKVMQRFSKPSQSNTATVNCSTSAADGSQAPRAEKHPHVSSGSTTPEFGAQRRGAVEGGRDRIRRVVAYKGTIVEWGVRKFPDRKDEKKTYENFALVLRTDGGEQVLQGEGLRDALAEAKSNVGDRVNVKRLHQIDVPAVDNEGRALLDSHGNQKIWKKWVWSIKRS